MKHAIVAHIAKALRIEVSIGQKGATRVVLEARCRAGGLHGACLASLRVFEKELEAVIEHEWPGCSHDITTASNATVLQLPEGVPPSASEPEPEPEPEPELEP